MKKYLVYMVLILAPTIAFGAQNGDIINDRVSDWCVGWFSSGTGKAIATLLIIIIAIISVFRKLKWYSYFIVLVICLTSIALFSGIKTRMLPDGKCETKYFQY